MAMTGSVTTCSTRGSQRWPAGRAAAAGGTAGSLRRRRATALAAGLGGRGVGRGDVVSWQLPNWYEAVLLYRACWLLGAIAVPFHHRLGVGDLRGVVDMLEPRVTLTAPGMALAELSRAVPVRDGSGAFEE